MEEEEEERKKEQIFLEGEIISMEEENKRSYMTTLSFL